MLGYYTMFGFLWKIQDLREGGLRNRLPGGFKSILPQNWDFQSVCYCISLFFIQGDQSIPLNPTRSYLRVYTKNLSIELKNIQSNLALLTTWGKGT